jgi:hypothetical protein
MAEKGERNLTLLRTRCISTIREINRNANLGAYPRACDILASEQAEADCKALPEGELSSDQTLKLASGQAAIVGNPHI